MLVLGLMEFKVGYVALFLLFLVGQLLVVQDRKSSQEYPVNAGVLKRTIFGPTLFLLFINDLADDAICILLSMLTILLSTLNVIWHLICVNN